MDPVAEAPAAEGDPNVVGTAQHLRLRVEGPAPVGNGGREAREIEALGDRGEEIDLAPGRSSQRDGAARLDEGGQVGVRLVPASR
ncbi:hypothetical protein D3C86_1740470 [compost metagenome]